MKLKRISAFLLAFALLLVLPAGCAKREAQGTDAPAVSDKPSVSAPDDTSVTVTDMTGREIKLDGPATRIVALTAADCEILYALGAGNTLVGRGEYCDWPVDVLDVPVVQSGSDTNIEQIIALRPQVLLMSTMAQTEEQIAALETAGVRVVVSDAQDIAGVYDAIGMLGTLLGKEQEAEALTDSMKETFSAIQSRKEDNAGKSIYFEVSPLEWGLWAAGRDTFMDEIARMLGLTNAFSDVSGWGEISEEQVIQRAPNYIVTIAMYFGDGPSPEEEIASRPGWEKIPAVASGAILNLQNNELSRPGPRLADGAKMLFDFLQSRNP